ncbi:DUF4129 domain-containing protein [Brevibacillus migulae]|uniref:DUF4129 domain-containing protein n=1 Tax=Brevibacillus migulae TaxID=1644114 RepID=UPI00106ED4A1|nr:DUF4129 domain-containing protein [Brevibacillus migulae]
MSREGYVEQDKQQLREILQGEEFRVYQGEGKNVLQDWLDAFLKWLSELFDLPEMPASTGNVATYLILFVVLAALLWLIIWLTRKLFRQHRAKGFMLQPGEESIRYADYLQLAKQQGESGNWNEGIRFAFLALLFYLQEREWVQVEKWKTNWEYQDELRERNREWVPFFRMQAQHFERVWYGRREADEASFLLYLRETETKLREGGAQ